VIECGKCGLQNLDHVTVCIECGNSLIQDISDSQEQVYFPARAGKYKNIRLLFYKIRRNTGALDINKPNPVAQVDSSYLNKFLLDLPDYKGAAASIIPGLGHVIQKRFLRGFIFFALWLACLLFGILFYGRVFSNFCFGCAIAIHASAAFDCLPLSLPFFNNIQSRVGMMLSLMALSLVCYYGGFSFINARLFGVWINLNRAAPVLMKGDFILIRRQTEYKRGDIVFYHTAGHGINMGQDVNFFIAAGTYFDRIIGLPGEKIEIIKGKILINNNPLGDKFYPINKTNVRDMTLTLKENQYFIYDSLTPSQHQFPINLLRLHNTVNEDNIRGSAFMIYAPLSRMQFLH